MPSNDPRSPFDVVAAELRVLGLTLRRLPGEYCVNFRNGGDHTAQMADDLQHALVLGHAMAAEAAAVSGIVAKKPPRRRWRRKRLTAKTQRRRFIRSHNRRVRARSLRKRRGKRKTFR